MEAVEVSDFHLVERAVTRLVELFPTRRIEPSLAREYNRATRDEYECLRDYLQLNYVASEWRDAPFWKLSRGAEANTALAERVALFQSRGRVLLREHESFDRDGWVAALLSAGISPNGYDPLLDSMDLAELKAHFGAMRSAIRQAIEAWPTQREYLDQIVG